MVLFFSLSHTLNTWIGKQGLSPLETLEMELGLKTEEVMKALSRCRLVKVTSLLRVESMLIYNLKYLSIIDKHIVYLNKTIR